MRITVVGLMLLIACSSAPFAPQAAHHVSVVATIVGQSASGDTVSIAITNSGTSTAYLRRCGIGPIILVEQFSGNVWTGGVQNFMCPVGPTSEPVMLEAGNSISVVRVFDTAGRYRYLVPVATIQDLSDTQQAVSNAFDVAAGR